MNPPGGYYSDDGTPLDLGYVPRPGLCILCRHDADPTQKVVCDLTRPDQAGRVDFRCEAYSSKAAF
jgi:hypothetical protein